VTENGTRRLASASGKGVPAAEMGIWGPFLAAALARMPELATHSSSVADLSVKVGERIGISGSELTALSRAAELHDIGKVAIPEALLNKRGPLDEAELDLMRQHTVLGERILSAVPALAGIGRLVRSSHERWDGLGYPDGIAGQDIPLASRIIFVCDAYDAMRAERPYAAAMSHEDAIEQLRAGAGSQFDTTVVEVFLWLSLHEPKRFLGQPQPQAAARLRPS
jgi:two-component system, cell cycle response regulator